MTTSHINGSDLLDILLVLVSGPYEANGEEDSNDNLSDVEGWVLHEVEVLENEVEV